MALPSVVGRAVHIKFHPRPHNLSESIDVLKVLERYGQVEYFRQLQFEPLPARNSAVAIYRHRDGATKACRASPLRFRYGEGSEQAQEYGLHATDLDGHSQGQGITNNSERRENVNSSSTNNGDALSSNLNDQLVRYGRASYASETPSYTLSSDPPKPSEATHQASHQQQRGREVHLQISESTLNHELYLKRQFYHGSWRPRVRTIMARDLEKRTPIGHVGNFELRKGEVLPRIRKERDENPKPRLPRLGLLWQESKARAEALESGR